MNKIRFRFAFIFILHFYHESGVKQLHDSVIINSKDNHLFVVDV